MNVHVNDFAINDAEQRRLRDETLAVFFYGRRTAESLGLAGPFAFLEGSVACVAIQRSVHADTVVIVDGRPVFIEEKIVKWKGQKYTAICLETESCTVPGRESPGWMRDGLFDYLLYCMEEESGDLDCYLIDRPALCRWFWRPGVAEQFPLHIENERNRTASRIVSLDAIRRAGIHVDNFSCPRVWREGQPPAVLP